MQVERMIYGRREVMELIGISRPTLYRWLQLGTFPEPIKIGPQKLAWRRDDVIEWLANRPEVTIRPPAGDVASA